MNFWDFLDAVFEKTWYAATVHFREFIMVAIVLIVIGVFRKE